MSEHDAQPFDDRHEPRPVNPFAFTGDAREVTSMPERGKAQDYTNKLKENGFEPPRYLGAEGMHFTELAPPVFASTGLVWRFQPGQELQDIGRQFGQPDALADFHEVDLRTILAHLDSAARSITRELEARGLGGRR